MMHLNVKRQREISIARKLGIKKLLLQMETRNRSCAQCESEFQNISFFTVIFFGANVTHIIQNVKMEDLVHVKFKRIPSLLSFISDHLSSERFLSA